uniref:ATP synthase subunit a n=1 Tax=Anoplodactylus australis TaxID=2992006 RepID=A0A9E7V789_9CHEL|nr:ATP synthase F0 subunit 6 [Anoplodactylus australis]UZA61239.1 ATP synthase F0 subunit 6 [Anoplodactylus australis]
MFSIFDPTSSILSMKLGWLILGSPIIMNYNLYWMPTNFNILLFYSIKNILLKEFKLLSFKVTPIILFYTIFIFIFWNNFFSLFPYIFSATSHLSVTLFLSVMIWLPINLFMWSFNIFKTLSHYTPSNTPTILIPFMFCIEMISNMIRPLTLSIRLMANITAGHLIIYLVSSKVTEIFMYSSIFIILIQSLMMLLELMVTITQAYIFSTLSLLYYNETICAK